MRLLWHCWYCLRTLYCLVASRQSRIWAPPLHLRYSLESTAPSDVTSWRRTSYVETPKCTANTAADKKRLLVAQDIYLDKQFLTTLHSISKCFSSLSISTFQTTQRRCLFVKLAVDLHHNYPSENILWQVTVASIIQTGFQNKHFTQFTQERAERDFNPIMSNWPLNLMEPFQTKKKLRECCG